MNDKSKTYSNTGKGTFSSIDLSPVHSSLYFDYNWPVSEDQYGSDHFPIIIESIRNRNEDQNPNWKLNKAKWDLLHPLCDESLTNTSLSESFDPITTFTSSLINISEKNKCIPRTSANPKITHGTMTIVKNNLSSASFQLMEM